MKQLQVGDFVNLTTFATGCPVQFKIEAEKDKDWMSRKLCKREKETKAEAIKRKPERDNQNAKRMQLAQKESISLV